MLRSSPCLEVSDSNPWPFTANQSPASLWAKLLCETQVALEGKERLGILATAFLLSVSEEWFRNFLRTSQIIIEAGPKAMQSGSKGAKTNQPGLIAITDYLQAVS